VATAQGDVVRTFVAILLDESIRARLAPAVDGLRRAAPGVAWVAEGNLHATLKFLGRVDAAGLDAAARALRSAVVRGPSFSMEIKGLGAFPTPTRPRVIWAGVAGGAAACAAVAELVEHALAPLGFAPEARVFSPHITLGRVREPRRDERLAALIRAGGETDFGTLPVRSVSLMRSDLSPRGPRYTELSSFPLRV
jgi:2'-5' RNA ligase